ncbi:hypothetical protein G3601_005314 [Salmonella enterica]|nr:hypothetical protein [Salmonella enterica subsp. enterica serovar Java]EDR2261169.1 hypothetical protein [Salmonella enterica]EDX3986926.1 hypothetical protein [Salmonella enterica subsp. enterica serovar 4,[5],12:b:-]EEE5612322.1 hypothetical protein [Salmonella enterica subsp. enterica serovar Typhimurium]EKN5803762.1 hypothetical protein [Salmonella enterica subsp. enterica]
MSTVPAVGKKEALPGTVMLACFCVADNGHKRFRHTGSGEPAGYGAAKSPG